MTGLRGFLLGGLSRLLEPDARKAVMGDLAELNLGPARSVCELCGLIARQQARLWRDWRPWLALLGIVGLVGIRLNFMADALMRWPSIYFRTYRIYGVIYQSGLSLNEEIIVWISMAAAVILWSWTAGFAFTSLAHRTTVVTGALICIMWVGWTGFSLRFFLSGLVWFAFWWSAVLLLIPWLLFFVSALSGAKRAFRRGNLSLQQAIVLLVVTIGVIALVTWTSGWPQAGLERWSEGAIHGGMPWYRRLLPYLLLSWPAVWIIASSSRHNSVFLSRSKSRRLES